MVYKSEAHKQDVELAAELTEKTVNAFIENPETSEATDLSHAISEPYIRYMQKLGDELMSDGVAANANNPMWVRRLVLAKAADKIATLMVTEFAERAYALAHGLPMVLQLVDQNDPEIMEALIDDSMATIKRDAEIIQDGMRRVMTENLAKMNGHHRAAALAAEALARAKAAGGTH